MVLNIAQNHGILIPWNETMTFSITNEIADPENITWSVENVGAPYVELLNETGATVTIKNNSPVINRYYAVTLIATYMAPDGIATVHRAVYLDTRGEPKLNIMQGNGLTVGYGETITFGTILENISDPENIEWTVTNAGAPYAELVNETGATVTIANNNPTTTRYYAVTITATYDTGAGIISVFRSFYLAPVPE